MIAAVGSAVRPAPGAAPRAGHPPALRSTPPPAIAASAGTPPPTAAGHWASTATVPRLHDVAQAVEHLPQIVLTLNRILPLQQQI